MDAHRASPSRTPPSARSSRPGAATCILFQSLHLSRAEEGVLCHRALCASGYCCGTSTQQCLRPSDAPVRLPAVSFPAGPFRYYWQCTGLCFATRRVWLPG